MWRLSRTQRRLVCGVTPNSQLSSMHSLIAHPYHEAGRGDRGPEQRALPVEAGRKVQSSAGPVRSLERSPLALPALAVSNTCPAHHAQRPLPARPPRQGAGIARIANERCEGPPAGQGDGVRGCRGLGLAQQRAGAAGGVGRVRSGLWPVHPHQVHGRRVAQRALRAGPLSPHTHEHQQGWQDSSRGPSQRTQAAATVPKEPPYRSCKIAAPPTRPMQHGNMPVHRNKCSCTWLTAQMHTRCVCCPPQGDSTCSRLWLHDRFTTALPPLPPAATPHFLHQSTRSRPPVPIR